MREFETFRLTVRRSERFGPFFAMHASMPDADPGPYRRISFYLYLKDFVTPFEHGDWPLLFADIAHKAEVIGDHWTFFDWEAVSRGAGTREVRYRAVELPRQVARIFYRYARLKTRALAPDSDHEIEISAERRERWLARYGAGKGQVQVEVRDFEQVQARYAACKDDPDFRDKLERLKQIALNTTRDRWQIATVRLGYDFAGFTFSCITPHGNTAMHGGLIHHRPGRDALAVELDAPAGAHWSIHT